MQDAFKREVLEETGLFAEPTGMLMVESGILLCHKHVELFN